MSSTLCTQHQLLLLWHELMPFKLAPATNWHQLEWEDDSNNVSIVTRMLSITLLLYAITLTHKIKLTIAFVLSEEWNFGHFSNVFDIDSISSSRSGQLQIVDFYVLFPTPQILTLSDADWLDLHVHCTSTTSVSPSYQPELLDQRSTVCFWQKSGWSPGWAPKST